MPDLNDLIARLEAATGPDRALDAEIAEACGTMPHGLTRALSNGEPAEWWWDGEDCLWPPEFTASVDAAITLAPNDLMWFLGRLDSSDMRFCATISERGAVGSKTWRGFSASPAIALCVAALNARG